MTVYDFIRSEIERYESDGYNRLGVASVGPVNCEKYVVEIVRRYGVAAVRHGELMAEAISSMKPGTHQMTDEELQRQAAASHQAMLVHLEIESYYLFSKILLDRTAQFMHWWFADTPIARGISIHGHSRLVKNLRALIDVGELAEPSGLVDLAKELQERIIDYRDAEVAHDSRHSYLGTIWSPDGKVRIAKLSPAGATGISRSGQSEHIADLEVLRTRYIDLAMQFLAQNRSKGKLSSLLRRGNPDP